MSRLQNSAFSFVAFVALSLSACNRASPPVSLQHEEAPAVRMEVGRNERPAQVTDDGPGKAARRKRGQADPMRSGTVELTLQAPAEADASHIEVEVRVRNVSAKEILWDREFSLPLYWLVFDDQGMLL